MRIEADSFEKKIKEALGESVPVRGDFELALFAKAEGLLSKRREQLGAQKAVAHRVVLVRKHRLEKLRRLFSRLWEGIAFYPDRPAAAAVFAIFLAALVSLHDGDIPNRSFQPLSYADLPQLPKFNDFPARYDAQVLSEKQAYEREVSRVQNIQSMDHKKERESAQDVEME